MTLERRKRLESCSCEGLFMQYTRLLTLFSPVLMHGFSAFNLSSSPFFSGLRHRMGNSPSSGLPPSPFAYFDQILLFAAASTSHSTSPRQRCRPIARLTPGEAFLLEPDPRRGETREGDEKEEGVKQTVS